MHLFFYFKSINRLIHQNTNKYAQIPSTISVRAVKKVWWNSIHIIRSYVFRRGIYWSAFFTFRRTKSSRRARVRGAAAAAGWWRGLPRHHPASVSNTYMRYITLVNYLKYANINIFKKTKKGYNHINVYFIGVHSFSKIYYNKI